MDQVLIIGGGSDFGATLKAGLDQLRLFEVLLAEDDLQAVELLFANSVSVVVIDINSTAFDCLETIAYMTRAHPSLPLVLMTGYRKPWYSDRKEKQEAVYHLQRPFNLERLSSAIFVGLDIRHTPAAGRGMTVSRLLPLIEMQRRTCRMEITAAGKGKGYLYFSDGILVDAHLEGLGSEAAATEIARWSGIAVRFSDLPGRRIRSRVTIPLMDLAGATWSAQPPDRSPAGAEDRVDPAAAEAGSRILGRHREALAGIRGAVGLAVTDGRGNLVEQETVDPASSLGRLAAELEAALPGLSTTLATHDMGRIVGMSLHTSAGSLHLLRLSPAAAGGMWLTGMVQTGGDRPAMASLMQRVFDGINRPASAQTG